MFPCKIPPPLTPGDRIWVIMPSGPLKDRTIFDQSIELWEKRGYQVDLYQEYEARWDYLAGSDEQRRIGLQIGLQENSIKAIVCGRGGYGGARLLENWTWQIEQTKWLIGFSDITSLLWGYAQENVSGVHGPVLTTFAEEPTWSQARLWDWIEGRSIDDLKGKGWGDGSTDGYLLPCNLTVATHLLGTSIQPDLSNAILAIEDVGEAPYRIDRMLTQWRLTGALKQLKGIAIGRFSQIDAESNTGPLNTEAVLKDRLGDLGIPIVSELPFGHDGVNAVLPVGVRTTLDSNQGTLTIHRE